MIETMERLLDEIRQGLESTLLQEVEFGDMPKGATYIRGKLPSDWRVLAIEFDIEEQGFRPGSKGCDGTATRGSTVLRLTRELAQLAFEKGTTSS